MKCDDMRARERDGRPLTRTLSPKGRGERTSTPYVDGRKDTSGTPAPLRGQGAKETCHSTKRTHRFSRIFFIATGYAYMTYNGDFRRISVGSFSKRTHREGVLDAFWAGWGRFSPSKEESLETYESAKRTGLEIDDFYVERADCQRVRMRGRKNPIRFVWDGIEWGEARRQAERLPYKSKTARRRRETWLYGPGSFG
jgi:hypothetical protein